MRKLTVLPVALAAAALPATGLASAMTATKTTKATTTTLHAKLVGKNEVPAKGSPTGSANATIRITPKLHKVCYTIALTKLTGINAGHIHQGKAGVSGNVVVALFGTASKAKARTGCVSKGLTAATLNAILKSPSGYYVNVHSSTYPGGAARGQLHK